MREMHGQGDLLIRLTPSTAANREATLTLRRNLRHLTQRELPFDQYRYVALLGLAFD